MVDGGRELAITLLRAVGSISRNLNPLRDEPAASEIAVPGAQALGETVTGRFAILPSRAGWQQAQAVVLDQAPVIPVDCGGSYSLAKPNLLGAVTNGQGLMRYASLAWGTGS